MQEPLDEITFLANSANRVVVLDMLATEPLHRDELVSRVDASRVTLARILSDFEARQWIERSGQECRVTPLGAWISEEFTDLLETMRAENRLREVLPWFPIEDVSFDVRNLREATIMLPSPAGGSGCSESRSFGAVGTVS